MSSPAVRGTRAARSGHTVRGATALAACSRYWAQGAVAVCLVLVYLPALTLRYGLKDDYTYLASAHGYAYAGVGEPDSSIRLGRPLFGVFDRALFSALPNVDALWVARAIAVLGLVLLGLALLRMLVPLLGSRLRGVLVVVLICSMPPFLVYAGWATIFSVPYSAVLGVCAALACASASERPALERAGRLVVAGLLLLVALAIYQPTAMMFWVAALVLALTRRRQPDALSKLIRCVALAGVPAMVGGYLVLKIGVWTLGAADAERSGLLSNVPGKLRWLPQPLGLALNLFKMPQSAWFGALVACLVVAGALRFCRDCDTRTRRAMLALISVTVPLSFAPNILSQENYATFRVVGPLTATFALLVGLLFVAGERDAQSGWTGSLWRFGLVGLTVLSAALGYSHLRTLFALPQSREWRLAVAEAARLPRTATTIGFLAPTIDEGPIATEYGVRDEFGVTTSASTWADPSLAWLAARSAGRDPARDLKVEVTLGGRGTQLPSLDMRDLRQRLR
jgi:hypothetical protein